MHTHVSRKNSLQSLPEFLLRIKAKKTKEFPNILEFPYVINVVHTNMPRGHVNKIVYYVLVLS